MELVHRIHRQILIHPRVRTRGVFFTFLCIFIVLFLYIFFFLYLLIEDNEPLKCGDEFSMIKKSKKKLYSIKIQKKLKIEKYQK